MNTLPMIDLGRQGDVLHLFFCGNLMCMSYGVGESQAVVLRCEEMGDCLTEPPASQEREESIYADIWLVGWEQHEDAVTPEQASSFYDDAQHIELPESIANPAGFDAQWNTKAGGVPYWTSNGVTLYDTQITCPPFEFLLQIDSRIFIEGTPPSPDVCDAPMGFYLGEGHDNGPASFGVDFANFGSDGIGFVFINRHANPAEVRWFWSR